MLASPQPRRLETKTMMTDHAKPEAFHKLLYGDSSREETRQIVRHLLGSCGRCMKRSATAQKADGDPASWKYDDLFDRMERWLDLERTREIAPAPLPIAVAAHP
jgi:hypothetical protein